MATKNAKANLSIVETSAIIAKASKEDSAAMRTIASESKRDSSAMKTILPFGHDFLAWNFHCSKCAVSFLSNSLRIVAGYFLSDRFQSGGKWRSNYWGWLQILLGCYHSFDDTGSHNMGIGNVSALEEVACWRVLGAKGFSGKERGKV
jgi:hypothetical protein